MSKNAEKIKARIENHIIAIIKLWEKLPEIEKMDPGKEPKRKANEKDLAFLTRTLKNKIYKTLL